jgi:hypothetical protein
MDSERGLCSNMVQSLGENGRCNRSALLLFGVVQEVGGIRQTSNVVLLFKVAAPTHHSLLA